MPRFAPTRLLSLLWLALASVLSSTRADYPIVSHRYLADPASLVHNGRVYLYCSNDDENAVEGGYEMKTLVCVSSADLKNWTDHGIVFRVPTQASWARHAWAPAVIARNGEFFLYFGNNASGIGVARSRSPAGPFFDARGSALITSTTPGVLPATNMWVFDPAVFIDDDGQAYLYFGGNGEGNIRVIRLNPDMISTSGSAIAMSAPNFFEASWLHKRDGLYYFSYSTNTAGGLRIDYMTSTSPTAGFTYKGIVAGQPPSNNNNNHHAIFTLGGAWYHAYHNRIVAMEAGIPPVYRRNIALERLEYNADGTIQQITYTTDGVAQLSLVDPYGRVEGETMNAQSGVETEPSTEGGMAVRFAQNGAWLRLRGVDFGSIAAAGFTARVATATGGGSLELRLDSASGPLIGTLAVPATGGAQVWSTQSAAVAPTTGVHDVYVQFTSSQSGELNLDWWRFEVGPPRILTQPTGRVLFPGATLRLEVGTTGIGNTYQWSRDGVAVEGQTSAALMIGDVTAAQAGAYTVRVSNPSGTVTSQAATVSVGTDASRLVNMSCRIALAANTTVLPSFYVTGTGTKRVLIRAVGPTLATVGVPNAHPDPSFRVYQGNTVIAENDNWDPDAVGTTFSQVFAFPLEAGSHDAALVTTLDSGQAYTVHVSGVGSTSGIVLLEVYDADTGTPTSRFVNVAVRGIAGQDASSLVMGFVLSGRGDRSLLLRGAGPALLPLGVTNALRTPHLILRTLEGQTLLFNTGWASANANDALSTAATLASAFPFPPNSSDTAAVATLPAAGYTVQITTPAAAGEALAEIYELP